MELVKAVAKEPNHYGQLEGKFICVVFIVSLEFSSHIYIHIHTFSLPPVDFVVFTMVIKTNYHCEKVDRFQPNNDMLSLGLKDC